MSLDGTPHVGEVLIARHPCPPARIRAFTAVEMPPAMRNMLGRTVKGAVIFSTQGETSAVSLLDGDYDGDDYLVMWEPRLLDQFTELPADRVAAPQPPKFAGPLQFEDTYQHLRYQTAASPAALGALWSQVSLSHYQRTWKGRYDVGRLSEALLHLTDQSPAKLDGELGQLIAVHYNYALGASKHGYNVAEGVEDVQARCAGLKEPRWRAVSKGRGNGIDSDSANSRLFRFLEQTPLRPWTVNVDPEQCKLASGHEVYQEFAKAALRSWRDRSGEGSGEGFEARVARHRAALFGACANSVENRRKASALLRETYVQGRGLRHVDGLAGLTFPWWVAGDFLVWAALGPGPQDMPLDPRRRHAVLGRPGVMAGLGRRGRK